VDPSPVTGEAEAKSVSHEHTFDVDTSDGEEIERTMLALAEGVAARLRAGGVRAATVVVKVRDSAFRTVTRQRTLAESTDLAEPIWHVALELARPEIRGRRIRLVGVGAHGLGEPSQLGLFAPDDDRRRRAVEATDAVRRRFGERAVTRARLLGSDFSAGGRDPMQPLAPRRVGRSAPAPNAQVGGAPPPEAAPEDDLAVRRPDTEVDEDLQGP
jgi:DNA polymerase-4